MPTIGGPDDEIEHRPQGMSKTTAASALPPVRLPGAQSRRVNAPSSVTHNAQRASWVDTIAGATEDAKVEPLEKSAKVKPLPDAFVFAIAKQKVSGTGCPSQSHK